MNNRERIVWYIDTFRQSTDGIITALTDSIFMLVAIQYFAVSDFWKGLIASSRFLGYFISAPLTGMLGHSLFNRSKILFTLTMVAALSLALGSFIQSGIIYALAVTLCSAACHLRQPFFTDLYGEFYSRDSGARRISLGLRLNLLITLGAGLGFGTLLNINLSWWRFLTLGGSAALAASGLFLLRLPESVPLPSPVSRIQAMVRPFRNRRFLYIQLAWMLVGFANLWAMPMRAVYLAEHERGLGLSPFMVTLVLVVIPVSMQFLFNGVWSVLYHKLSFPAMRISINFFFAVSIPLFFLGNSLPLIIISAALLGMGLSGSPYIWQLWVTRIAAQQDIRFYQSSHAFLTGIRGLAAPFIGFAVLRELSFQHIGFISAALALSASLMMLPLFHRDRIF
ncbi:MAG: hypothetical protein B0D92_03870 [Spirochaeta sp. LUC14_002_19_P3]|nr:MAG: hypothetical protein B0D92_03870 [Spirochaeta sp. LUC14_002_19_P3]